MRKAEANPAVNFKQRRKRSNYQMEWQLKNRAVRWMESRGYHVIRLGETYWWFLATKWEQAFIVIVKRKSWTTDEDHQTLKLFETSKLPQIVLRWDHKSKIPRVARVFQGRVTELYVHDLLPKVKEGRLVPSRHDDRCMCMACCQR